MYILISKIIITTKAFEKKSCMLTLLTVVIIEAIHYKTFNYFYIQLNEHNNFFFYQNQHKTLFFLWIKIYTILYCINIKW